MLQDEITNINNGLAQLQLYLRLSNEQTALKARREEFSKQFSSQKEPDFSKAIHNYLRAGCTRDLYKKLEEMAYEEGRVPTKAEMQYFSRELVKRLMVRAGHRPQLYGEAFTRGLFMKALSDGPAKNPYHEPDPSQPGEEVFVFFVANFHIAAISHYLTLTYCRWPTLRGTVWL